MYPQNVTQSMKIHINETTLIYFFFLCDTVVSDGDLCVGYVFNLFCLRLWRFLFYNDML